MLVCCDLDGCIVDVVADGQKYLAHRPKDWEGYYSQLPTNKPIPWMVDIIDELSNVGYNIIFVTSRPEKVRESTEAWLQDQFSMAINLYMNLNSGAVPARDFKLKTYLELKPDLIIEDEPQAVVLFKKNGFKVLQVHGYRWTNEEDAKPYV